MDFFIDQCALVNAAHEFFYEIRIDLFDNPVGCLTVLQFFRLSALQNRVFLMEVGAETEVSKQL
jgi:hypothetical protein